MIINLTKKVRKLLVLMTIALLTGIGGIYNFLNNEYQEAFNLINNTDKNNYKMDIVFEEETKRLICNQNVEYVNKTGGDIKSINFHIYPNAFSKKEYAPFEENEMNRAYPNGFNEGYIDIKNITSNNKKIQYEIMGERSDILNVSLNESLKDNEVVSIDIKYNVKLPNSEGRFGYGENTINVTNWFPIACVYDTKGWNLSTYEEIGDPFYSETSNFEITMLIPRKYEIGTTGNIVSEKSDEHETMYNIEAKNVRDFAFVLSDMFDVNQDDYKGIKISTYNLNENISEDVTKIAKDSIRIFSDLFGEYPYDTYSVVASDFYIGGMEYPTMVMIDQALYQDKDNFLLEYVIAHETAHQWWYSVVGNNEINEPWIDEALTEYSTVLYFEEKYGKDVANELIKTMEIQTQNHKVEDIFKSTKDYDNSTDYSLNVYTKGAMAFNQVRKEVGDDKFFDTLQQYYQEYMYQNVSASQFVELWNEKGIDIEKIISEYK